MPNAMAHARKKGRPPHGRPLTGDELKERYQKQALILSGAMSGNHDRASNLRKTVDGYTGPQRRRIKKADNRAKGRPTAETEEQETEA